MFIQEISYLILSKMEHIYQTLMNTTITALIGLLTYFYSFCVEHTPEEIRKTK